LSTTFTVTEFAKTHLQQSRGQKKFFASGGLSSNFLLSSPSRNVILRTPLLSHPVYLRYVMHKVSASLVRLNTIY